MPKGESTLIDRATASYLELNASWIKAVFKKHGAFSMSLRDAHADCGHHYRFENVILNTRLGSWGTHSLQGKTCGENGGRTVKGVACKKKATVDGRCPLHPPPLFTVAHDLGKVLESVTVEFGNDSIARPLPVTIAWNKVRFVVNDAPEPLSAVDKRTGNVFLVSGTRVWDNIILYIKETLNLPPEAHVRVQGTLFGVDPLWTVEKMILALELPLKTTFKHNDTELHPGHLLSDYGLQSGGCIDLEFCVNALLKKDGFAALQHHA